MFRDKERKHALARVEIAMSRNFHNGENYAKCSDCRKAAKVAVAMLWEEARAAYGMGRSDAARAVRKDCTHEDGHWGSFDPDDCHVLQEQG